MTGLTGCSEKTLMFKGFIESFHKDFERQVEALIQKNNLNEQYQLKGFSRLYLDFYANIFKFSIRTLIRELHRYKEEGRLCGRTKEERFKKFPL